MSTRTLSFSQLLVPSFVAWVAVTGIAAAISQFGSLVLSWTIGEVIESSLGTTALIPLIGAVMGIGMGGVGAASQMLFLRGRVDGRRWIGGAIVGAVLMMMLAMAVIAPASETLPEWTSGLLAGSALGLGVSVGQWVALRGQHPGIGRWAIACFLSYALSIFLLFSAGGEGRELIALAGSGLAFGLISGLGAFWAGLNA